MALQPHDGLHGVQALALEGGSNPGFTSHLHSDLGKDTFLLSSSVSSSVTWGKFSAFPWETL